MRPSVLALLAVLLAAPAWCKPKKKDKPPKKADVASKKTEAVKTEVRDPVTCPEGAPDQPTIDTFGAGDEAAAQAVKAYAAKCPSFGCRVGKDLYLKGYTYKDDKPDVSIKFLEAALALNPRDDDCGAKAAALLAKLSKANR